MAFLSSHHIALKAANYPEVKAFYTETLGFKIIGTIPNSQVVFIDILGTTIELSPAAEGAETKKAGPCGLLHLAWEVDDVDKTYDELVAKGVEFFITPRGAGDIRIAFFRDPDGNELELFRSPTLTWA